MPQFSFVFLNLHIIFNSYIFQVREIENFQLHYNVISSAISMLLNFVILKYQGKTVSPFETYQKTVFFGVTSLLVYCFAYHFLKTTIDHPINRMYHRCGVLFGYLSIASLASLLYPDSATPLIFLLCTMISAPDLVIWVFRRIWAKIREALEFQLPLFLANLLRKILMNRRRQIILPL